MILRTEIHFIEKIVLKFFYIIRIRKSSSDTRDNYFFLLINADIWIEPFIIIHFLQILINLKKDIRILFQNYICIIRKTKNEIYNWHIEIIFEIIYSKIENNIYNKEQEEFVLTTFKN